MASNFKIYQEGQPIIKDECNITIRRVGGSCVDINTSIPNPSRINVVMEYVYSVGDGTTMTEEWAIRIPPLADTPYRECLGMGIEIESINLVNYTPLQDTTTTYEVNVYS